MTQPPRPRPPALAPRQPDVVCDPWAGLRSLTPSRIALGRAGHALPTREVLRADEAHARARAAVLAPLDIESLCSAVAALPGSQPPLRVTSAAPDRQAYLLRPDLGRRLSAKSRQELDAVAADIAGCDLAIVIADGLSTSAVQRHAVDVVAAIQAACPPGVDLGPTVVATQARVALGDEIGQLLKARLVAMLIGERPGLSCQESLGIYLTWQPQPGRTDAERNCLSNIHPGGLSPVDAATRLWWLTREAQRLGTTGVALKDRSNSAPPLDSETTLTSDQTGRVP